MIKYRHNLPQLNGKTVLTDGGLETVMVFQEGIDLPLFAAFHLMDSEDGMRLLSAISTATSRLPNGRASASCSKA